MPQLPLLNAPEGGPSQGLQARLNPTMVPTIKLNPNMYAGVGAAGERMGDAIGGMGEIAYRVKQATDAAYVTRSQTQMEAANLDFQNWTKTHPDPSTWDEELNARIGETKASIQEGAKALSPMAQLRLNTDVGAWETGTRKHTQLQATEQNINIAQATFQDYVTQAVANNDIQGVEQKVQEGVEHGIFHPTVGQRIIKQARVQVATNQANAMIAEDPFKAEARMTEKNDDGTFKFFGMLTDTARETLKFRAHKAAVETRANTVTEWSQMVANAQQGAGPMPDRDQVEQEAAHQGISPKVVAKLFALPAATDPHEFAQAYGAITSYDADKDPTHEHLGELVARVEGFKGPAKDKLNQLLSAKIKVDDPLNRPVITEGEKSIKDMFEIGGYGHYKQTYQDPETGKWSSIEDVGAKQSAEVIMARNLDMFHQWAKENPNATHEQAQKYINSLNSAHATSKAANLIQNHVFGFPQRGLTGALK